VSWLKDALNPNMITTWTPITIPLRDEKEENYETKIIRL
jgi:hypothetical protein